MYPSRRAIHPLHCFEHVLDAFECPIQRFATERTVTVNTAAVGGNTSLFAISGEEG